MTQLWRKKKKQTYLQYWQPASLVCRSITLVTVTKRRRPRREWRAKFLHSALRTTPLSLYQLLNNMSPEGCTTRNPILYRKEDTDYSVWICNAPDVDKLYRRLQHDLRLGWALSPLSLWMIRKRLFKRCLGSLIRSRVCGIARLLSFIHRGKRIRSHWVGVQIFHAFQDCS